MECAHFKFRVFVVAAQLISELFRLTFVLPPFAIFVLLFFSLPKKKKKITWEPLEFIAREKR